MFEIDLGALLDQAEATGNVSGSDWENGRYKLEVVRANTGTTKDGKSPKLGLMWKALDAPYAGQSNWENLAIDKNNATSVSIFINKLISLGLTKEFIRTNPPLDQIAGMLEGIVAEVEFSTEPWKSDPSKLGKKFKVLRLIDTNAEEGETENAEGDSGLFGNA